MQVTRTQVTASATDKRLARGKASRDAIVATATAIIARDGIAALTHRAVAAQAGVSSTLVTYHFAAIQALRRATLQHVCDQLVDRLQHLLTATPDPDEVPRVAADLAVHLATDLRDVAVTMFELMAQATRDADLQESVNTLTEQTADLIEPVSGDRQIATTAATVVLGFTLTAIAQGRDHDLSTLHAEVISLVQRFDPRMSSSPTSKHRET